MFFRDFLPSSLETLYPSSPFSVCYWTQNTMIMYVLNTSLKLGYTIFQQFYSLYPYNLTFPFPENPVANNKTNHRHQDAWGHIRHQDYPTISLGKFWSSVLPVPWIWFLLQVYLLEPSLYFFVSPFPENPVEKIKGNQRNMNTWGHISYRACSIVSAGIYCWEWGDGMGLVTAATQRSPVAQPTHRKAGTGWTQKEHKHKQ